MLRVLKCCFLCWSLILISFLSGAIKAKFSVINDLELVNNDASIVHPNYLDQGNQLESLAYAGNFAVIKGSNLEEAEEILKETAEIVAGEADENYRLKNEEGFLENFSGGR